MLRHELSRPEVGLLLGVLCRDNYPYLHGPYGGVAL
jgi:hypothetical protein